MEETLNLYFQGTYSQDDEIQVVAFNLGKEEYAVDILNVQEINRLLNITRVPRSESHIEGVLNLRGNIIPIINLHKKFNLQSEGNEEDKRIVVFQFNDLKVGIIVDEVSEVLRLGKEDIEETGKVYSSINAEHIKGIAKVNNRLLILLDLLKILES
ncbi:MAG: chemotaxis protein CheW [Syntrophomonadaceae bacterium]|jgi:purine-binding chemotaxis protein CheW|nr:chemotaxis protein CheW [Syntrophomonadaceae bacterium]NLX01433.1 chemotaxis protein CheW [Syntrophomonadaceae bacterium]